ncbi:hypothetical protein IL992_32990 [Microbispora sp. NEAU-D428]|uniref:FAD-linked oxidase C-terminal domain-containing protein n=1 Tax=Microbispora sitophila TaxID=2771537 RepID=UPI00186817A7|nr:FAD-linked oxidase C-terminal domain-containing protein [Microbispora sitophila]MBE3013967.1 hypothetical protein [Microbispora sitophila]
MAIEPRWTVTGEHGLTTLKQPWLEKGIGGAGRRPAARAKVTFDPLGKLDPDQLV